MGQKPATLKRIDTFFSSIFAKVEWVWQFDSHPDHSGVQVDVELFRV